MVTMRDAVGRILEEIGKEDKDVIVITADVGKSTRVYRYGELFPDRYFNVGIAEQHLIGFASGLAAVGAKPVVVAFAIFLMRAWEQIRNSVSRMNLNVKIIGTHAGFSDHADGSSHQAFEDIALMRVLPNMSIIVPADVLDIERSLRSVVIDVKGPIYYRIGRDYSPIITDGHDYKFSLGKAYVLRDGHDVTIIGAGVVLYEALMAAKELEKMGISAMVINLLSIKPIDVETIEMCARRTGRIVVVEEHMVYGGIGSAIAEVLVERYPVPMRFIGMKTFGRSARCVRELLDFYDINSKAIVSKVLEVIKHGDRGS